MPDDDSPPIDTLEMKKQLTASAFTDEQADAIVEALRKDMQRMRWQLTVGITLATSALVSNLNYLIG